MVPDGPVMREKPVLLMRMAAPAPTTRSTGPLFRLGRHCPDRLSRSSRQRPQRGRPARELESGTRGDDVRAFCDALGIANPIVLGASSADGARPMPRAIPITLRS